MLEIVQAGGWLMVPIIVCSVAAVGIVLERLWTLQRKRVLPKDVASQVWEWVRHNELDAKHVQALQDSSPLGEVLAAALVHRQAPREVLKEAVEDAGRHAVHGLERYLSPLGTIAAISPLLGLLGTVSGMIRAFTAITTQGVGNPTVLAGGISEALVTTAAGLAVAIPSLIAYRYLRNRVDGLVVLIEKEAIRFVDVLLQHQRTGVLGVSDEATAKPLKRRA
ncbi:MAG TPA: MotA/TolQ/ExbB proton channel family protein [Gammaproteobacteria bacterium]|jgi:biopolymer transport protein ExbB|nr:MotA/TolQ/ExbB proton channel family protein [Gammaproteobacteria bacterium]